MDFLNNFHFYLNTYLYNFDELLTILLIFNFFKLVMWSSILELLWPTQFFNRRNNIFYQSFRFRTFVEYNLKLNTVNLNFSVFFSKFVSYYFNKK